MGVRWKPDSVLTPSPKLADVAEQANDTQDGLCDLAEAVDVTAAELQDGLCEQADAMLNMIAGLAARIEALEEAQKGAEQDG